MLDIEAEFDEITIDLLPATCLMTDIGPPQQFVSGTNCPTKMAKPKQHAGTRDALAGKQPPTRQPHGRWGLLVGIQTLLDSKRAPYLPYTFRGIKNPNGTETMKCNIVHDSSFSRNIL